MICKECGEDLKHEAHGLCRKCYYAKYRVEHREVISQYYAEHRGEILQSKKEYRVEHREEIKQSGKEYRYAHGGKPASENKHCSAFLGIHIAEQVLSKVFKDVKKMPYGYRGYDFICIKDKKIDVKSACTKAHDRWSDNWHFNISRNQIADYFLCLAFDNREHLNPLYIWLIPGCIINHRISATISKSTLSKWDEFKLDIGKVVQCCDSMKQGGNET